MKKNDEKQPREKKAKEKEIKEKKIKEKKVKEKKVKEEKKPNKIIEVLKTKWLIDNTTTFLLIGIIITLFIAVTLIINKVELPPIDFSQEKLYTLTEESKEKVKGIDKDVKLYFVGYLEEDPNLDLAKQYNNSNEKIVAESVDPNNRPDLVQKYGIEPGIQAIIVECGEKFKILAPSDLMTYDSQTYETISIAEEKLTTAIEYVTSNKIPKIYFLDGFSKFSLRTNMNVLGVLLSNEVNNLETLNIVTTGKVPDDCDTLIINTPERDFDEITTNAIMEYIQKGKNILWLNASKTRDSETPNVNKILALYGVNPFEKGLIEETNTAKMVTGAPNIILPEIEYSKITEKIHNTAGIIMINPTKINIAEEKLEELRVVKTDLIKSSADSFYRTEFQRKGIGNEEKKQYLIGAEFEKTIQDANEEQGLNAVKSKLVLYAENIFASDLSINPEYQEVAIQLAYNKDLILNTISYLVDRPDDIKVRKSTGVVTYTATEQQDIIVRTIIFAVPAIIIIMGIVVWQVRRRKK